MADDIAARQAGMVARRQLTASGVDHNAVRHQVDAQRWVVRTPRVVSTTTGPLSEEQRRWLGVLHAGPPALLGGLTALAVHGLQRWHREAITVWVDDDLEPDPVEGVEFVRTRRDLELMGTTLGGLPVARPEPAALLVAGYHRSTRTACGLLAACVQQRLTTAERLHAWVDLMRPLRRARLFRAVLGDIAGGAESMAELDLGRVCTRYDLARPVRQVQRRDRAGRRRWTDAEWVLPDGRTVVLEVDGAFHLDAERWQDDIARQRGLTRWDRIVVRATAWELRASPGSVVRDLRAVGVPGRGAEPAA